MEMPFGFTLHETNCRSIEISEECINDEGPTVYSDRYDDSSAVWVMLCAILMFFMKAGFLFIESSFISSGSEYVRRVVFAKYIDIFAGTFGFWLFGYAISGNTDAPYLGEEQDYIFWFFRFTFATNTATIIGGTLVGQELQMTGFAIFIYSFLMTAFVHPLLARLFWSTPIKSSNSNTGDFSWSPFGYCNGTYMLDRNHTFKTLSSLDLNNVSMTEYTFFDFAGSGMVHVCGGIGGLMLAIFHKLERKNIKNRIGCCLNGPDNSSERQNLVIGDPPEKEKKLRGVKGFLEWLYPPGGGAGNVQYAALGTFILWTTWFGFNAGSTENICGKSNHAAVGRVALNMCLSCASAGLLQAILSGVVQSWRNDKHINTNEIANAVIGGLVAVTGCCPFIKSELAVVIGLVSVIFYSGGCILEYLFRLHDGARVFPLHAMCGLWGVLCVGFFSKQCLIKELYENLCFCEKSMILGCNDDEHARRDLIFIQFIGSLIIVSWSFACCFIIFLVLWLTPVCSLNCLKNRGRGNNNNILFTRLEIENDPMVRNKLKYTEET